MFIEAFFALLLGGGCAWFYVHQRSNLRRQALRLLQQAVLLDALGHPIFEGARARILLDDYAYDGTDETGLYVVAKFLCEMPGASVFWVTVETARKTAAGRATVEALTPYEVEAVIAAHPDTIGSRARPRDR